MSPTFVQPYTRKQYADDGFRPVATQLDCEVSSKTSQVYPPSLLISTR